MKRPIVLCVAVALLAPSALAQPAETPPDAGGERAGRPQRAYANPSALIAADIGLARLAREKGRWAAMRETAADGAELFDGRRVIARDWLKTMKDAGDPVGRTPHAAWISCDGTAAFSTGAAQFSGDAQGVYLTVWERQAKGKIAWKWALDDAAALAVPLPPVDWATGTVADCPARRRPEGDAPPVEAAAARPPERIKPGQLPPMRPLAGPLPASDDPPGTDSKQGQSRDGSLAWRSAMMPDGRRRHTVWIWKDGAMRQVLDRTLAAGQEG